MSFIRKNLELPQEALTALFWNFGIALWNFGTLHCYCGDSA